MHLSSTYEPLGEFIMSSLGRQALVECIQLVSAGIVTKAGLMKFDFKNE